MQGVRVHIHFLTVCLGHTWLARIVVSFNACLAQTCWTPVCLCRCAHRKLSVEHDFHSFLSHTTTLMASDRNRRAQPVQMFPSQVGEALHKSIQCTDVLKNALAGTSSLVLGYDDYEKTKKLTKVTFR